MKTTMTYEELNDLVGGANPDYEHIEDYYDNDIGSGYVLKEKATGKIYFFENSNMSSWHEGGGLDWDYAPFTVYEVNPELVMVTKYNKVKGTEISIDIEEE